MRAPSSDHVGTAVGDVSVFCPTARGSPGAFVAAVTIRQNPHNGGVAARTGSGTSGDAVGRMLDSLRLRYEDELGKKVVGRFYERDNFCIYYNGL